MVMEFFNVQQNELNNNWMVCSNHPQLPQCFAFKRKTDAIGCKNELNIRANKEWEENYGIHTEQCIG